MTMQRLDLPVDGVLPEIVASLACASSVVVEAAPGAGKTTRVPAALLDAVAGEVWVLEPRRIAARLAARRVAWEMGEEAGGTAGYQVRFEERAGPKTRLRFVTEGILTRRMLSDPALKGVDAVVLDEFHERHLEGDLALALLKRLQTVRPELKLVVMSATLDAAPVAAYLGGCPIVRSEGRAYPLTVRYQGYSPEPLERQVRTAVVRLNAEGHRGNVLAFLPGAAEIRRAMRECVGLPGLVAMPLHGDLTPAEQDRVVQPSGERKLILATNVAESSVTVEGVTAVIDSGLARFAAYSPWTGLPTLEVGRVSKASAAQRAGRAGRTAPGQAVRLYSEADFALRAEHDAPEIVRSDLAQLLLGLRAMGIRHPGELEWLDAPPEAAVERAEELLDRIGATGAMAGRLARLPVAPRLARVVVEAMERGVGQDGCRVAAMLGLGGRWEKTDLLEALDSASDARLAQHTEQLARAARPVRQDVHNDDALLMAVLAGFPDRVARRRVGGPVVLANGVSVEAMGIAPAYEFMVCVEVEDRRENTLPLVRMTARCEPEWLLEMFSDRVRERVEIVWNRAAERVERVSALVYGELVLEESRGPASGEEAAEMLAAKAVEAGIERFVDAEALEGFRARVRFAGMAEPDAESVLRELCVGLDRFSQLKEAAAGFLPLLESKANPRVLNELAPVALKLKGGRAVKVHYEDDGRPPWIASRLQDFFGMRDTPRIGPERTPVVVHLLAPNQRAVQTTTDLAGFWERLYPAVRKELMRRYPRHQWPEKGDASGV